MSGRRRWGRAGQRLTPIPAREGYSRALERQRAPERLARDRAAWARGEVIPARITIALDAAGLWGPDVDTACGAAEPDVDRWEAGELYPTWEQLQALAELTGLTVGAFFLPVQRPVWTSLPFHVHTPLEDPPPVLTFSAEALAEARRRGVLPQPAPGALPAATDGEPPGRIGDSRRRLRDQALRRDALPDQPRQD